MGATKNNNYSAEELSISQFGRALAHPARAKIVGLLLANHVCRNVDLTKLLQLSTTTVHNHLKVLLDADLITMEYVPHQYHIHIKRENYDLYQRLIDPTT